MLRPQLLEGRWLLPDDANALVVNTDFLQDEPEVRLGDTLKLELVGSKQTTWQVVGLIQGTTIGPIVYANYDYYSQVVNEVGRAKEIQLRTITRNGAKQGEIAQRLEVEFKRTGLEIGNIVTIAEIRSRVEFGFNFLLSFLLAMAVVLAIVGGLGLSGTMSINVIERVREIGVMRAVGASDWIILQVVLVEGLVIGLLSWLSGALLALPLSRVLSDQLGLLLLDNPLRYTYSSLGLVLWLAIATGLAVVASYLPARSASRLTVREVLAYE
jgi:putative ABC transport system permease protein